MAVLSELTLPTLLGMWEQFGDYEGVATRFFSTMPNDKPGNVVAWDILQYGRDMAAINVRGGNPNAVNPPILASKTQTAISLSEKIIVPPAVIKDLRAPGEWQQKRGLDWITNCIRELRLRIERRKDQLCFQCLGMGTNDGKLTFSVPGVTTALQIDLGFPAANHASTLSTGWGTPATADVIGDLDKAKRLAVTGSGRMPDTFLCNSVTKAVILATTAVKDILKYNPARSDLQLAAGLPPLAGMNPVVTDTGYVADDATTYNYFVPDNAWSIFPADTTYRKIVECEPESLHAPDGYRGVFFHTVFGDDINDGAEVQFQYDFLPVLLLPGEICFDLTCTS